MRLLHYDPIIFLWGYVVLFVKQVFLLSRLLVLVVTPPPYNHIRTLSNMERVLTLDRANSMQKEVPFAP